MTDAEFVRSRVAIMRPRAKFVAYTHSSKFIDRAANLGDGFYHVSLYDEKIDCILITNPRASIMIHNTYLSSFAYNLLLCRLLYKGKDNPDATDEASLKRLLMHNFKKYFAEQLFAAHNNVFSRAILLETLLYEQQWMIPVFEAKAQNESLSSNADKGAQLMSLTLSTHELGHFYLGRTPQIWDEILEHHTGFLPDLHRHVAESHSPYITEEFRCDVIAVISCFEQFKAELSAGGALRLIVFSFAVFAVLYSLTKSARKTAAGQKAKPDEIDLESIEKRHADYDYTIDLDFDFIERAKLVQRFCELLAEKEKLNLYSTAEAFPLDENVLRDLLSYVDTVMDSEDANARSLSLLVAEAFHEHPQGAEYLYLRSKTFSFGEGRNADGSVKTL